MQLEQGLFQNVIAALDARQDDPTNLRNRRCVRYRACREIQLRPYGVTHATPRLVKLVDISAGGICVIDRMNLSSGDRFVICLPKSDGHTEAVLCAVRQSRLTHEGEFRVGAEFSNGMDAHMRLVSSADGVVTAVTGGGTTGVQVSFPVECGKSDLTHVADIQEATADGFVLITTHPADVGEPINLDFRHGHQQGSRFHAIVIQTKMLATGQFRLVVRMLPPEQTQAQSTGLRGWFRRAFAQ